MAYMALYRKWRPRDFSDLIGQEHISKTLSNAIVNGKVAHAYLFAGPRGTGKTSTAKILAKALNCEHGPTPSPCNQCICCQKINDGSFMDVFEIDAASNRGIDEIRDLRETVKFAPVDGRYKVYIIDEVHKVPITIQSRCQRYDFKRITKDDILNRLLYVTGKMDIKAEKEALEIIAVQADGGMRDALSLLDQCLAFTKDMLTLAEVKKVLGLVGHNWIWQITDLMINKDSAGILSALGEIIAQGKEIRQMLNEFMLHLRSLLIYKATGKMLNLDMYLEDEAVLQKQSDMLTHEQLVNTIQKVHEAVSEIKWATQPRITAEVLFLKLCWQNEANQSDNAVNTKMSSDVFVPSAQNSVSSTKITALEQQIARLDRIVKALSTQVATLNEKQEQIKVPVNSVPVAPIAADRKQKTFIKEVTPQTAVPLSNADIAAIWQNVLAGLNARGKTSVVACVKWAVPYQLVNNQFFVHFDSTFLQARTQQDDYRQLIEEVLYDVTVQKLRLVCTCQDNAPTAQMQPAAPPKSAATAEKAALPPLRSEPVIPAGDYQDDIPMPTDEDYSISEDINYDELTPENKHTLETAMEIFGGKIIPEDEINN